MSKLSREEFESILEECFIEGYNSALEDIQEDYDNYNEEYDVFTETQKKYGKEFLKDLLNEMKKRGASSKDLHTTARLGAMVNSTDTYSKSTYDSLLKKIANEYGGKIPAAVMRRAKEIARKVHDANKDPYGISKIPRSH